MVWIKKVTGVESNTRTYGALQGKLAREHLILENSKVVWQSSTIRSGNKKPPSYDEGLSFTDGSLRDNFLCSL
jgi:hypothetical protein